MKKITLGVFIELIFVIWETFIFFVWVFLFDFNISIFCNCESQFAIFRHGS